jgi:hypothetical protein
MMIPSLCSQKLDEVKCVGTRTCGHWFAAQQDHAVFVVTPAISVIDQAAELCCSNAWWMQAWLVPLGDEGESVGAAVHSGFRASWHSGLRQLVNDLVSGMMASRSNQAGNMRVLITGQARCHTPCCFITRFTSSFNWHLTSFLHLAYLQMCQKQQLVAVKSGKQYDLMQLLQQQKPALSLLTVSLVPLLVI